MKSLLSQYRSVIDEYHPELSRALRPGLARESVVEKMSSLPFEISSDAVELYCWADGINQTKGKPHLIPISYFVPLESAIRNFESLLEFREMYGDFGQQYSESFPFLSDGSDGGYGFGSTDAPCSGRIIEYVIHDEWQIGFHSLTDLVETAIEAYREGLLLDASECGTYGAEWEIDGFYELVEKRYPNLNAG